MEEKAYSRWIGLSAKDFISSNLITFDEFMHLRSYLRTLPWVEEINNLNSRN